MFSSLLHIIFEGGEEPALCELLLVFLDSTAMFKNLSDF